MISHARVAISDTVPTKVTPSNDNLTTNCTLQIQNLGEEAVYIGGTGLTNTNYGASLVPGGALTVDDLPPKDDVYALSASGSSYVAVLKVTR